MFFLKIFIALQNSLDIILGLFYGWDLIPIDNPLWSGIISSQCQGEILLQKLQKLAEVSDTGVDVFYRIKGVGNSHLLCC